MHCRDAPQGTVDENPKLFLPFVLLAACVATAAAQKPKIDFDASYDFSAATTFAISRNGQPAANEMVQRRIEEMVEAELEIKGLRATSPAEADLTVIIGAYSRQRTKQSNVSIGVGVSRRTSRGSISVSAARPAGGPGRFRREPW